MYACVHEASMDPRERQDDSMLKCCIFPLTIPFIGTSTHEHSSLEKKAVGMKTTGIHWPHNTHH